MQAVLGHELNEVHLLHSLGPGAHAGWRVLQDHMLTATKGEKGGQLAYH